ncbi:MAG: hypothetical protein IT558_03575 [Alphaproteobacteria bacterium]|nr:hypothetical protein [Alphaproteobacteria bacterium]
MRQFPMSRNNTIQFIENKALLGSGDKYVNVTVDVTKVLKSCRLSLLSYEWLNKDGSIKTIDKLPDHEKPKREAAEKKIRNGEALEQPVLGIGIMDNVEIGMGRAEFLTLAAHGIGSVPAHIPKSCAEDFKPFLADVN